MSEFPYVLLKGAFHRGSHAKTFIEDELQIGDKSLILEREPDNKFDVNAIKVMVPSADEDGEPWHLCYVQKEVAAYLAPEMDDGTEFEVEVTGFQEERVVYPVVTIREKVEESTE